MIPVSYLDAGMLYAETPEMPMHTLGVLILEPDGEVDPEGPSPFELTRRVYSERIHLIPPFRRRIVQGPLQIGDPHWIEDPAFDLDNHLAHITLPAPGDMTQLREFIGAFAGIRLDRDKPLWKAVLVEGLEDGKMALVMKIHHAAMDGVRAAAIANVLMDTSPEGREIPPPEEPWVPDREPGLPWLAADAVRTLAGKPIRATKAATKMLGAARAKKSSATVPPPDAEPFEKPRFDAPPTPFNRALTPNRSVAFADVSFDDVKAIKEAFDTTVNNVVLAACSASLSSWLDSHGGLPDRPLVATVPVSVRGEGEDGGNRISMIRAHLPVQPSDPVERLRSISEETSTEKRRHHRSRRGGSDIFEDISALIQNVTVPWVTTHLIGLISSQHLADHLPPMWNLIISNVPGPPAPLFTPGVRLTKLFPLGPAQQGSGLDITVMSVADRLCLGAMACTELVPDVQDIADGFAKEIEVLKARIDEPA